MVFSDPLARFCHNMLNSRMPTKRLHNTIMWMYNGYCDASFLVFQNWEIARFC